MTNRQRKTNPTASDHKSIPKKKWLALTAVGVALLLIPRRSSRRDNSLGSNNAAEKTENTSNNHKVNNETDTDTDTD